MPGFEEMDLIMTTFYYLFRIPNFLTFNCCPCFVLIGILLGFLSPFLLLCNVGESLPILLILPRIRASECRNRYQYYFFVRVNVYVLFLRMSLLYCRNSLNWRFHTTLLLLLAPVVLTLTRTLLACCRKITGIYLDSSVVFDRIIHSADSPLSKKKKKV